MTELPVIDLAPVEAKVAPFVARAKALVIKTKADDETSQKEFLAGKAIKKFIEDLYEDPKSVLSKAHKDMCAKEKKTLAPVVEGLRIYEEKILAFRAEENRKAQAEADRLAIQARKDAEEAQLREAIAADERGDVEQSEDIMAQPVEVAAVSVQANVAKVSGVGTSTRWHAEVTDLKALVKFVAGRCDEDPGVLAYLDAAMPVLNREATNKKKLLTIPGVKAVSKEGMSGRIA